MNTLRDDDILFCWTSHVTILHIPQEEILSVLCISWHHRMLSEHLMILHCNKSCSESVYKHNIKHIKHTVRATQIQARHLNTLHEIRCDLWNLEPMSTMEHSWHKCLLIVYKFNLQATILNNLDTQTAAWGYPQCSCFACLVVFMQLQNYSTVVPVNSRATLPLHCWYSLLCSCILLPDLVWKFYKNRCFHHFCLNKIHHMSGMFSPQVFRQVRQKHTVVHVNITILPYLFKSFGMFYILCQHISSFICNIILGETIIGIIMLVLDSQTFTTIKLSYL